MDDVKFPLPPLRSVPTLLLSCASPCAREVTRWRGKYEAMVVYVRPKNKIGEAGRARVVRETDGNAFGAGTRVGSEVSGGATFEGPPPGKRTQAPRTVQTTTRRPEGRYSVTKFADRLRVFNIYGGRDSSIWPKLLSH